MGNNVIYYLCCGCCDYTSILKKGSNTEKMKNLQTLKEIKPKNSPKCLVLDSTKDPTHLNTTEMTDIFKLPEQYGNETELLKHLGYKKIGYIDSGSYGVVSEAEHIETKLKVAIKEIKIPEALSNQTTIERIRLLADVKTELYALQKLRHPHVIQMITHFMVIKDKRVMTLYIVMQLAKKWTLSKMCEKMGPIDEPQCKIWFAQLLSGLSYMHRQGFAHRDLKQSNILLDETNDCLISDFGLSKLVWRPSIDNVILSKTFCGTPPYIAPEVLELEHTSQSPGLDHSYNAFLVDVWALGVILFKIYDNSYPFSKKTTKAIRQMKNKKWSFSRRPNPSPGLKDILMKMFEPDPLIRPHVTELQKHYWIEEQFRRVEEIVAQKTNK